MKHSFGTWSWICLYTVYIATLDQYYSAVSVKTLHASVNKFRKHLPHLDDLVCRRIPYSICRVRSIFGKKIWVGLVGVGWNLSSLFARCLLLLCKCGNVGKCRWIQFDNNKFRRAIGKYTQRDRRTLSQLDARLSCLQGRKRKSYANNSTRPQVSYS